MNLIKHVAIIMDGNGRWGLKKRNNRNYGHTQGLKTLEKIVNHSIEKKIQYLTLFAFSTENWKRPNSEINFLFSLLNKFLKKKIKYLHNKHIKLKFIGSRKKLNSSIISNISNAEKLTKKNNQIQVNIALNYGSRDEILESFKKIKKNGLDVTKSNFEINLYTKEISRANNFAHVNYIKGKAPRIGKLLCINGAGIQYRWMLNNLDLNSYKEMNAIASEVSIGSDGVCLIPFGNGAERMLNNKMIGTRIVNLNLNNHHKGHLCRAALEGIAFSFVYGMEILISEGLKPKVIRAGNDNLFRSEVFSKTVATLIEQEIEIYNTTGAIGAARAAGLHSGDYKSFGSNIINNDYETTYIPSKLKTPYEEAYKNWKKELKLILNK